MSDLVRALASASEEDKPELVRGTDTTARIDRAISLPTALKAPDGRLFEIRSWEPSVAVGSMVSVKVDVVVRMRDSST